MTFSANGENLLIGDNKGVRVWRVEDGEQVPVEDGEQVATMRANVLSLAVSKDGRWIAAGTLFGYVFVWNATTHERVFSHWEDYHRIGVDFSPDSTRLVSASHNRTASIWDIANRRRMRTLEHGDLVIAAKYSPQGDRIATATHDSVRVWDSNDGRLLADITVTVTPWYNTGLLWFNSHLFAISGSKIKEFDVSAGSAVSNWPIFDSNKHSSITLSKHGKFIAYSTNDTVTFWNTATHTQLGLIQHSQEIRSISVSQDDRLFAIGGKDGNITINSLPRIIVGLLSRRIVVHLNNFLAPIIFP